MRFILVDEIIELEPGKSIKACKTLSADEDVFRDHFPGFPVVPGVLLTEMMAQTAGKCLDAEKRDRGKTMLARITSASFRQWLLPNQTANIYAIIKTNRDQYASADCHVQVNNKKIASAELFFTFVPHEKFSPNYKDDVLESYLQKRNRDK